MSRIRARFEAARKSNRAALIRVGGPGAEPPAIEFRAADPSANPYLLVGALLVAAAHGLEAGLELSPVSPAARPDVFATLGHAYSAGGEPRRARSFSRAVELPRWSMRSVSSKRTRAAPRRISSLSRTR